MVRVLTDAWELELGVRERTAHALRKKLSTETFPWQFAQGNMSGSYIVCQTS